MMKDVGWWADKTSIVSEGAQIGDSTKIWQFCNILDGAVIGSNCNIGQNVFIENGVLLGNRVKVKNNVALYSGVECEDDVFLGPNCVFTNVLNPRSFVERKTEFKKTIIRRGASIGANATIVCGHEIGQYALIGAGAVVTRDVQPYSLVVGNPARMIGYVCECGERLSSSENGETCACVRCGKRYLIEDNKCKYIDNIE